MTSRLAWQRSMATRRSRVLALALAILLSAHAPARAGDQGLTGDWGGLRTALSNAGLDLSATYIGETLGNAMGGLHRGTVYEGRLSLGLDVDLGKLAAWPGATFHASAYQIHGHGPSANLVGNFLDVSGIEALPSTRLFTLWLQQRLLGDRLSIRIGQLAMDDEFLISTNAANLVNATFGNPAINYANMTAGGPIYPVAAPGLRARLRASDKLAILAGVFTANPGGSECTVSVQVCDPSGTNFSLSGGALWVGELQYRINQGKSASGLPGTYKLGAWRETGDFADQHLGLDATGAPVSLAAPGAIAPLEHHGDFAVYGVVDQMIWRKVGTEDQGLSAFLRLGGAPPADNFVSFYADGGLSWAGPFAARPDDIAIVGAAYARISPAAASLDHDRAQLAPGYPVRDAETVVELSYIATIRPWWSVQPDLQYIVHPGGHVPNPNDPPAPIADALVIGMRTSLSF